MELLVHPSSIPLVEDARRCAEAAGDRFDVIVWPDCTIVSCVTAASKPIDGDDLVRKYRAAQRADDRKVTRRRTHEH